ncbi:MAG: biotin/lipoate A/B protein ligase family protein [Promethearchaeota archaeon]
MNEQWRLLDVEFDDPFFNMAAEEAILAFVGKEVVPSTIRFWRNKNAVFIGRFQCFKHEVDLELCKKHNVKIVRRFTGGGAVYHDYGNLNYSFFLHKTHPLIQAEIPDLIDAKIFGKGVILGLKKLGIEVRLLEEGGLGIKDHKISGTARALRRGAFLHHGSLLVNSDLDFLQKVLHSTQSSPEKKCTPSKKSQVTSIEQELGKTVSIVEVKEALISGFEEIFNVNLISGQLTNDERRLAKRLFDEKYASNDWHFQR